MDADRAVRLPVRIEADSADVLERFTEDIRSALAESDLARVHEVPQTTRGFDLGAGLSLIVTAVEAGQSIVKVVQATRHVVDQYRQRGENVRLTMARVDVAVGSAAEVADRIASGPRPSGDRHALIIANAEYDDGRLAGLRGPVHDAEELTRVLGDPSIGGFTMSTLLDGDERAIRRAISAFFAARARDDVCVLHFSCHGIKDEKNRLHFAARDTDLSMLDATAVPASFVNDVIGRTISRRVILILDCCYSGAFMAGAAARADDGVPVADEFRGGTGLIVLTASSATEYAFEGGELANSHGRPSVFTGAIVRGLESGLADFDGNGDITIEELYDYVHHEVRETNPGQVPGKWIFGMEGNVIIARSTRPLPLPPTVSEDLSNDRVSTRQDGVQALVKLLASPKQGLRATALAELQRVADEDDSVRLRDLAKEALRDSAGPVPEPDRSSHTETAGTSVYAGRAQVGPVPPTPGRSRKPLLAVAAGVVLLVAAAIGVVVALGGSSSRKPSPSSSPSSTALRQFTAEAVLSQATNGIAEVGFSADGHLLVTASHDNKVELWDAHDPGKPSPIYTFPYPVENVVTAAAFDPVGTMLVMSTGGTVKLWSIATPANPALLAVLAGPGYQVAFSPDGRLLATTHQDALRLWNVSVPARPVLVHDFGAVQKLNIEDIAFSSDGQMLASASLDGTAKVWNVADPAHPVLDTTLLGHTAAVEAITFKSGSHVLATAGLDGLVKLWDLASPTEPTVVATIPSAPSAEEVAFSPDGGTLLVVSSDNGVLPKLWDIADPGRPVLRATLADPGGSWDVQFSPDGRTVATGDVNGVTRLWNLSP
jgi:WD40 repeat protein